MFKIRAWIKESGVVVRYIREGLEDIEEVFKTIKEDLRGEDVLEIHITKEL